jgi:hypothetical protein
MILTMTLLYNAGVWLLFPAIEKILNVSSAWVFRDHFRIKIMVKGLKRQSPPGLFVVLYPPLPARVPAASSDGMCRECIRV